jgi:large subunit ribosomal protein L15
MTHGKGKKGGRGAGLRGGKGNAGLCKHKFMYMNKYMPGHYGVHGFKRPQSILKEEKTINVGEIEEKYPGKKTINLTEEGYDKILGAGQIKSKIKITINKASEKAIGKIKEQGGDIILPSKNSDEEESIESKANEKIEDK